MWEAQALIDDMKTSGSGSGSGSAAAVMLGEDRLLNVNANTNNRDADIPKLNARVLAGLKQKGKRDAPDFYPANWAFERVERVKAWAAIDDMVFLQARIPGNLVLTNPDRGLTEERANLAIQILNKGL